MNRAVLALFILCIIGAFSKTCNYDWECGNMPYSECIGGADECAQTYPGLAFDEDNNLFYLQRCNGFTDRNTTLKKLSIYGGSPTSLDTRRVLPAYFNNVYGVADNDLYVSMFTRFGLWLSKMDLETMELDPGSLATTGFDYDSEENTSYVCYSSFGIRSVSSFNGAYQPDDDPNTIHYSTVNYVDRCTSVRSKGDDLYFTSPDKFYIGVKTCVNCDLPSPSFQIQADTFNDFDVVNDKLYFATNTGAFISDLDGQNKITLWNSAVIGIREHNGKLFWNTGSSIYSSNLDGSNKNKLNQESGICGCAQGYSGPNCGQCTGKVQWYQGTPDSVWYTPQSRTACIPIGDDGFPTQCQEHYQCGNPPFSVCRTPPQSNTGDCRCRVGFVNSPLCDRCEIPGQQIVWNDGVPSCSDV